MTDNYSRYRILKYLDAPNKTLFWTHDEIAAFVIPCIFGIWIEHISFGVVLGAISGQIVKQLMTKFGRGCLAIAQYWYLYQMNNLKIVPPSYIREFIG